MKCPECVESSENKATFIVRRPNEMCLSSETPASGKSPPKYNINNKDLREYGKKNNKQKKSVFPM